MTKKKEDKIKKPNKGGRPAIEDSTKLTPEMEDVAQYVRAGFKEDEIAGKLKTTTERIKRMLNAPILKRRIENLFGDKFNRWAGLSDRLYEVVLQSLIDDTKNGKLGEKTRIDLLKRLEARFEIFSELTESQTIQIDNAQNTPQIPDKLGEKKGQLFNKTVTLNKTIKRDD